VSMFEAVDSNYREVVRALYYTEKATNRAIRERSEAAASALTKVQMLLVSIKAEAGLVRVLYLPNGIPGSIRTSVLAQATALEKWKYAIDECFRFHYSVPRRKTLEQALDHDVLAKRVTLLEIVQQELNSLISIRNKLAHGQFVMPLNEDLTSVQVDALKAMAAETALSLKFKDNIAEQLTKALGDLVQSPKTFERLFRGRYAKIRDNREVLSTADYSAWVSSLRATRRSFPDLASEYITKFGFPEINT
jgi:hypothetical protein